MIGAYKRTSRVKLMSLAGIIDIIKKIEIMKKSKELPMNERKDYKKSERRLIAQTNGEFSD